MEGKCPICKKNGNLRARIISGKYISERCTDCLIEAGVGIERGVSSTSAEYSRERQREDFRKDIIQPYIGNKPNRDFAQAYPDKAKEYFTETELKEMGI